MWSFSTCLHLNNNSSDAIGATVKTRFLGFSDMLVVGFDSVYCERFVRLFKRDTYSCGSPTPAPPWVIWRQSQAGCATPTSPPDARLRLFSFAPNMIHASVMLPAAQAAEGLSHVVNRPLGVDRDGHPPEPQSKHG